MQTPPVHLHPALGRTLAIGCGLLAAVLAAVTAGLAWTLDLREPQNGMLTMPATFAVFFAFVACRLWLAGSGAEWAPSYMWRRLAFGLLTMALIGALTWHWTASLIPGVVGLICLLKDPYLFDKLKALAWIP